MNIIQISDWNIFRRDGEQFLQTAHQAYQKKARAFSMETLYNLICMGIEKLVMAFLMKNGDLADNHTMYDLLDALRRHVEVPQDLADDLIFLGTFQEICDEDNVVIRKPTREDVTSFLQTSDTLSNFLLPRLQ